MNDEEPASGGGGATAPAGGDMRWFFFSPSGRISRQLFVLGWLFVMSLNGFFLARLFAQPEDSPSLALWSTLAFIAGVFALWTSAMLTVKRLHDVGMAGAFAVLIFIPALSVIVVFGLCIWPGTSGPNPYGDHTNAPQS
jgi:uncharacterized membrane protein YhaH (DUF805 family)